MAGDSTKIISSNHYDQSPGSTNEIIEEIDEISGSGNIIKIAHTYSPTFGYDCLELITEVRRELAWSGKSAFTSAGLINSMF